jgi:hypothetical protein
MRGHRLTLLVLLAAVFGLLVPGGTAGADGNNTCKFDTFPTAPGGSSAYGVGCFLTSAIGSAGNKYVLEDFPQAHWHTGAARKVTASAANLAGTAAGTCVASTTGHFTAADINNGISGTNIPSNTFINAVGTPACAAATQARISANLTAGKIANGAVLLVENSDGRTVADATFSGTGLKTITSPTAHFCKSGLSNCGTKTDVGKTIAGTQVSHLATIATVISNTQATVNSTATVIACPAPATAADCAHVSFNPPTPPTTTREVIDATFGPAANQLCSATAGFAASDVGLKVASSGTPSKFAASTYILSVAAPCVTLSANFVVAGTNKLVVIGEPNASAPANMTAVAQLNSELSVSPTIAPGEPACTSGILTGSALMGGWNNPGFFDTSALGAPAAVTQQTATTPPALGPIIGQLDYVTGQTNLSGYVVQVGASTTNHETDHAAHYDVYYPLLLTGVAVCSNTAGVASDFSFSGQSLTSQLAGQPGDVRGLTDFATGTHGGMSVEHIYQGTTQKLSVTSLNCNIVYPPTNGFNCGGN